MYIRVTQRTKKLYIRRGAVECCCYGRGWRLSLLGPVGRGAVECRCYGRGWRLSLLGTVEGCSCSLWPLVASHDIYSEIAFCIESKSMGYSFCMWGGEYIFMWVWVCECYIYIYIYIYLCLCVWLRMDDVGGWRVCAQFHCYCLLSVTSSGLLVSLWLMLCMCQVLVQGNKTHEWLHKILCPQEIVPQQGRCRLRIVAAGPERISGLNALRSSNTLDRCGREYTIIVVSCGTLN